MLECFGTPFDDGVRAAVGMCERSPESIVSDKDLLAGVKALGGMLLKDVGVGLPAQVELHNNAARRQARFPLVELSGASGKNSPGTWWCSGKALASHLLGPCSTLRSICIATRFCCPSEQGVEGFGGA